MFTLIAGIILLIVGAALAHYYVEPVIRIIGLVLAVIGLILVLVWVLDVAAVHDGRNNMVFGGPLILLLQRLIQRRRRAYADPLSVLPGRIIRSPRP